MRRRSKGWAATFWTRSIRTLIRSGLTRAYILSSSAAFTARLSKRFPCAIYYKVEDGSVFVPAILDCRRDPGWIEETALTQYACRPQNRGATHRHRPHASRGLCRADRRGRAFSRRRRSPRTPGRARPRCCFAAARACGRSGRCGRGA